MIPKILIADIDINIIIINFIKDPINLIQIYVMNE